MAPQISDDGEDGDGQGKSLAHSPEHSQASSDQEPAQKPVRPKLDPPKPIKKKKSKAKAIPKQLSLNPLKYLKKVSGVILYPWTGCPEVVMGTQEGLVMVGVPKDEIEKLNAAGYSAVIRQRLKFLDKNAVIDLKSGKPPGRAQLHEEIPESLVTIELVSNMAQNPLQHDRRGFRGRFDPTFLDTFLKDFRIFTVDLHQGFCDWVEGQTHPHRHGNDRLCLFAEWISHGNCYPGKLESMEPEEARFDKIFRNSTVSDGPAWLGPEYSKVMDGAAKAAKEDLNKRIFPFDPFGSGYFNFHRTVAPYHPTIFFSESPRVLNTFFASDIHVVSRLEMLAKSDLRLVPWANETDAPRLGGLINSHGRAIIDLLNQGGNDTDIDLIVLGGDLVDFSQGFFGDWSAKNFVDGDDPAPIFWLEKTPLKADFVHQQIAIRDDADTKKRYQRGTDALAFFKIVLDCYIQHGKPIAILAGNHDAYDHPFGVYPMILGENKRTNTNIPGDANLTIMEARLLHGDTATAVIAKFNFMPYILKGFYFLFNPLASWSVRMGRGQSVFLGWGEDESMISPSTGHSFGHLPIADEDVGAIDITLLDHGVQLSRHGGVPDVPLHVFAHYTFVNYEEKVLLGDIGEIPFAKTWYGKHKGGVEYNTGTFYKGKPEVWKRLVDRKIDLLVSGHSHRMGVYSLLSSDESSAKVHGQNPKPNSGFKVLRTRQSAPIFVVSDAAGPLPRRNDNGEFQSQGRDYPAATKIVVNAKGDYMIQAVKAKSANAIPRLAVIYDGHSVIEENRAFFQMLRTDWGSFEEMISQSKGGMISFDSAHPSQFEFVRLTVYVNKFKEWPSPLKFSFESIKKLSLPRGGPAYRVSPPTNLIGQIRIDAYNGEGRPCWIKLDFNASGGYTANANSDKAIFRRGKLVLDYSHGEYQIRILEDYKWAEFPDLKILNKEIA